MYSLVWEHCTLKIISYSECPWWLLWLRQPREVRRREGDCTVYRLDCKYVAGSYSSIFSHEKQAQDFLLYIIK